MEGMKKGPGAMKRFRRRGGRCDRGELFKGLAGLSKGGDS